MLCIPCSCCFLVFLCVRFLSLLLALQQAQVHRKRNSYASSIAFSSLEVLPVLRFERFIPLHSWLFLACYFLGLPFMKSYILFLASKQAQVHWNRSSYAKVIAFLVLLLLGGSVSIRYTGFYTEPSQTETKSRPALRTGPSLGLLRFHSV